MRLPPGLTFEVTGQMNMGSGLFIVQMRQVESPLCLLNCLGDAARADPVGHAAVAVAAGGARAAAACRRGARCGGSAAPARAACVLRCANRACRAALAEGELWEALYTARWEPTCFEAAWRAAPPAQAAYRRVCVARERALLALRHRADAEGAEGAAWRRRRVALEREHSPRARCGRRAPPGARARGVRGGEAGEWRVG